MNPSGIDCIQARRWFWMACAFEGSLAIIAFLLAPLFSDRRATTLHWSLAAATWGAAGTLPLFALLMLLLKRQWRWMKAIVEFLDRMVRPILGQWSLLQLALLSALAGLGEEFFFRAVIQQGCNRVVGPWLALILSSLLFGAFHSVTRGYAALAAGIGVYLGLLWILSGNLLVPIITHALYDFVALVYFVRLRRTCSEPDQTGKRPLESRRLS
jgi:uncharacterized protein